MIMIMMSFACEQSDAVSSSSVSGADLAASARPLVRKDMQLFLNLVEFARLLLPTVRTQQFEQCVRDSNLSQCDLSQK